MRLRVEATSRAEPFGFVCGRCARCCYDNAIQLNPYEVARLAANRGIGTTELRARWTEDGAGTFLRREPDGACVFLKDQQCAVHADRPLVCRIYPLGRQVSGEGVEGFVEVPRRPLAKGEFNADTTIAGYLAAQGADPFLAAADGYRRWFERALHALGPELDQPIGGAVESGLLLLDIDAAIAAYQAETGELAPTGVEARHLLHLKILDRQLEELKGDQYEQVE